VKTIISIKVLAHRQLLGVFKNSSMNVVQLVCKKFYFNITLQDWGAHFILGHIHFWQTRYAMWPVLSS